MVMQTLWKHQSANCAIRASLQTFHWLQGISGRDGNLYDSTTMYCSIDKSGHRMLEKLTVKFGRIRCICACDLAWVFSNDFLSVMNYSIKQLESIQLLQRLNRLYELQIQKIEDSSSSRTEARVSLVANIISISHLLY